MDDIDRAQQQEQRFTQAALKAATQSKQYQAIEIDGQQCCCECGVPLDDHRIPYGICVSCKQDEEKRAKHYG